MPTAKSNYLFPSGIQDPKWAQPHLPSDPKLDLTPLQVARLFFLSQVLLLILISSLEGIHWWTPTSTLVHQKDGAWSWRQEPWAHKLN